MKRIIIIAIAGFMSTAIIADTGPPIYAQTNIAELTYREIVNFEALMVKDHLSLEQLLKGETDAKLSSEKEVEKAKAQLPEFIVPQSDLFTKVVTNGYVTKIPNNICETGYWQHRTKRALKHDYPASGGISYRS